MDHLRVVANNIVRFSGKREQLHGDEITYIHTAQEKEKMDERQGEIFGRNKCVEYMAQRKRK